MKYIDIHSHIHDKDFDKDRDDVLKRMGENGVATITIGTHLESSRRAVALAEKESLVYATVGIHPTDTKIEIVPKELEELAHHKKVVAIGECGIDYFDKRGGWANTNSSDLRAPSNQSTLSFRGGTSEAEKKRQRELFELQVELALKVDKPLMIHGRPSKGTMDAYHDILDILYLYSGEFGEKLRGNVHFFVGDVEIARKFLELGFSMSFTGVLTFTSDYDEVVRFLPLDKIMTETDSPYATPVPYRGKRNEPIYVKEVVKKIAELRGENEKSIAKAILDNSKLLFHLEF